MCLRFGFHLLQILKDQRDRYRRPLVSKLTVAIKVTCCHRTFSDVHNGTRLCIYTEIELTVFKRGSCDSLPIWADNKDYSYWFELPGFVRSSLFRSKYRDEFRVNLVFGVVSQQLTLFQ